MHLYICIKYNDLLHNGNTKKSATRIDIRKLFRYCKAIKTQKIK